MSDADRFKISIEHKLVQKPTTDGSLKIESYINEVLTDVYSVTEEQLRTIVIAELRKLGYSVIEPNQGNHHA